MQERKTPECTVRWLSLVKNWKVLEQRHWEAKIFQMSALIFDWENYWALEYTSGPSEDLKYVEQIHKYYNYFYERNISVDMIPVDADFSQYKMVVAPVLYMVKEGMKEALESFVKNGGILITTYMSGIVDQSDNVHLGGYPGRCVTWRVYGWKKLMRWHRNRSMK